MEVDYAIKLVTRRSTTRKKNYIEQQTTIIIKQHLYISLVLCKFQLFFAQRPTALHNSRNNMIGDLLKSKSRLLFSFCRQQPFFFALSSINICFPTSKFVQTLHVFPSNWIGQLNPGGFILYPIYCCFFYYYNHHFLHQYSRYYYNKYICMYT